jgi:hypothetical protein
VSATTTETSTEAALTTTVSTTEAVLSSTIAQEFAESISDGSNGNQVCTPNEIKMQNKENDMCKRCKCAANGIGWFCTNIVCPTDARNITKRDIADGMLKCANRQMCGKRLRNSIQTEASSPGVKCVPGKILSDYCVCSGMKLFIYS